jgi:glycine cleavage system aminomethyltransferase T/glycine/D-amino acid oxidase-like deaminating enzyme
MALSELPSDARVVVIGGGIVGCSVAYHLGRLGWSDTVLLERDVLTSGTSWHAAGIVGPLRSNLNLTRLSMYAVELFQSLEAKTGQATGYRRTGGLWLAQTRDRMAELHRTAGNGEIAGLDAEMISAGDVSHYWPELKTSDLAGALWVPADGQTNPVDTTMAYAKGARQNGVKIIEKTPVLSIETTKGRVSAVITDRGRIACEYVVNCCGMWARQLGASVGVDIPLQATEHVYFVTEPIDGLPDPLPITRDLDASIYMKEDAGKLVIGGFEDEARPWCPDGIPMDASYTILPEDWDRYAVFMENGIERFPVLENAGIRTFMNGPESFTPDTRQIIGEAPTLKNFFVAAGFNSIGVVSSAGAGKVIAEWIDGGEPPMDVWEVDIQRFGPDQATTAFLSERCIESLGNQFAMHWPYKQATTARNTKFTPFHNRLVEQGAHFGTPAMTWERPLWFGNAQPYSYGDQHWWPYAEREALATRDSVALYDLTPFSKFDVSGPDAEAELQHLIAADVAVDIGKTVYGQMLNEHGGIEADVTVMRLEDDRFWVIGGAPTRIKDLSWITRHLANGAKVSVNDVTEDHAVLGVMGPNARTLLARVCNDDLSNGPFAFSTWQDLRIGGTTVRANRLSYVGELGWELYIPYGHAVAILDALLGASDDLGLIHAGMYALDSCRLEKGYRHWGHDMGSHDTPLEVGLGFAVAYEKGVNFMGRDAMLRKCDAGTNRRLVLFSIEGHPLILHDEPVFRDGVLVGQTTSGGRAFRVGGSLAFAMIQSPETISQDWIDSGEFSTRIAGRVHNMSPLRRPPYDPDSTRLKS